jgi:hypothetical protein
MLYVLFAALSLWAADAPRVRPDLPSLPMPWLEQGNRHARRRDRKLAGRYGV